MSRFLRFVALCIAVAILVGLFWQWPTQDPYDSEAASLHEDGEPTASSFANRLSLQDRLPSPSRPTMRQVSAEAVSATADIGTPADPSRLADGSRAAAGGSAARGDSTIRLHWNKFTFMFTRRLGGLEIFAEKHGRECGRGYLNVPHGYGVSIQALGNCHAGKLNSHCLWPNRSNAVFLSGCFDMCILSVNANANHPCPVRGEHVHFLKLLGQASVKTMIDVGANWGDATSLFPLFGIKVIGFEPMPEEIEFMRLNIDLSTWLNGKAPPVKLINSGLGAAAGKMYIRDGVGQNRKTPGSVEVPIFLLGKQIAEDVGLLKMDIEGMEPEALRGSLRLFCQYNVEFINLEFGLQLLKRNSKVPPEEHLRMLSLLGYHCQCSTRPEVPECHEPHVTQDTFVFLQWLAKQLPKQKVDLDCRKSKSPSQSICH